MISRNLAIMITDIKGFTSRTSHQTRAENEAMLREHAQIVGRICEEYAGTVVKSLGDSFLVTYESSTNAVLAGIEIQKQMAEANAGADNRESIEIRIAISAGDVRVEENDVFGEAVNIASRLEKITGPNEVYFTDAVLLSMNRSEAPHREIGLRKLQGIPYDIRVYQAGTGAEQQMVHEMDSAVPEIVNMGDVLQGVLREFHSEARAKGAEISIKPVRTILPPINIPPELLRRAMLQTLRFCLAGSPSHGSVLEVSHGPSAFRTADISFTRSLADALSCEHAMSDPDTTEVVRGAPAVKFQVSYPERQLYGDRDGFVDVWEQRYSSHRDNLDLSLRSVCEILKIGCATICVTDDDGGYKTIKVKFYPAYQG